MAKLAEFERYMKYLCEALGHQDRYLGFSDYSRGLMLPNERKRGRKRGHSTFRFGSEDVLWVESLVLDKKKQMSAFSPVTES